MREVLRATGVIARRDFTALVGSKAFLLFLLAPLLLVGLIVGATRLHDRSAQPAPAPRIGLLLPAADAGRIADKRDEARRRYGIDVLPELEIAVAAHADRHSAFAEEAIRRSCPARSPVRS